jgi:hypothetical protein
MKTVLNKCKELTEDRDYWKTECEIATKERDALQKKLNTAIELLKIFMEYEELGKRLDALTKDSLE